MVPEDDEDDLLFGVESVDDSVFPLVPDSLVDSGLFQNLKILASFDNLTLMLSVPKNVLNCIFETL